MGRKQSTMSTDNDNTMNDGEDSGGVDSTISPNEFGYEHNIFGEPYIPTLSPGTTISGDVITSTGDDGKVYAGSTVRQEFERASQYPEQATWFGYWQDKAGLRSQEVGIPFDSWFQHAFLTGTSGCGKTTVLLNGMTQLAYAGWGFCYIDPGGDAVYDLLQRIPEYRLDDVIWIQAPTGNMEYVTSFNFLEVPENSVENELEFDARATNVVKQLVSIVGADEEMYARMTRVLRAFAKGMIESDEDFTLLDLYQTIDNENLQRELQDIVSDDVLEDSISRTETEIEQGELEPLSGRIEKWVMNKTSRRVVSHPESSVDIEQAVEDGKIILIN